VQPAKSADKIAGVQAADATRYCRSTEHTRVMY